MIEIISAPVVYHLWFVYMIIGIYLFVPYLKKMLQSLTDVECRNLFILLYLVSFIKYLLPSFGIHIEITNLLIIEWLIPFVFGYLMTRDFFQVHYRLIYVLGGLSFIFLIVAKRYFPTIQHLYDLAPTMLIQSQAIFLLFMRNRTKICCNDDLNKMVCYVASYCYEIYLIHAMILDFLQRSIFIHVYIISPFITTIVAIVLTFVISFCCAFIINHLIIKNVLKVFYYLVDLVKKLAVRLHI